MIAISGKEFGLLADYIHKRFGIYLKEDKQNLLKARLDGVLSELNMKSYSDYFDYLVKDKTGTAAAKLLEKVTTNHTFFMRETPHFDYLRNEALPYWQRHIKDGDLRIWSAGCSSGEEPYTLAMLLLEYFAREPVGRWDHKILATDISNRVLEAAVRGIYPSESLQSLPSRWQTSYFVKRDAEHAEVSNALKKEVIFRKFNLMEASFPFKRKFHMIFCRNVMIYFDNETKSELIQKFYNHLEPGGFLFIGHAETISRGTSPLVPVRPSIYRKGGGA
ncbi:CheR family methyltransferase [Paenibacillus albus]|uniref:protein-glutamate O-methyltransferase n=1 Tax=Paenibacillus albus TaxID=2495582 RepID=A0A3Q8X5N2_9BACL|nr:protein-glutamate O-methyltransferase CheR [Paenibacillus albus]AZN39477.1 protein-glutamate O-methyltransferase CheR [Paenibacillus albus]